MHLIEHIIHNYIRHGVSLLYQWVGCISKSIPSSKKDFNTVLNYCDIDIL